MNKDRFAPEGTIWVCAACGKTALDQYGIAGAADEIRRLRAAAKKAIDHAERNGMADWPVFRNLRKALV